MMFNSMQFAIFFPLAILMYFILPKKIKNLWLLIMSYLYYMCWRPEYALLMLASTVITFVSGLIIGKYKDKRNLKSLAVAVSFVLNIGILGFFKYSGFLIQTLSDICEQLNISVKLPVVDVLLPVGISFYIFQALSYTVDVYREEISPEKNFFKYALFVSFFPQLVAGPIERSKNLLNQFDEVHLFEYERVKNGLVRMLWGFFMKLVIVQRVSIIADLIYEHADTSTGYQLMLGTMAFAIEIYCDFAGYSEIAIGAAEVLGFSLMENFKQPFFAKSCKELWNRWHISLNTWFRDYLYFPLGGSRKGLVRKYINLMIVFLVSGLWHGAAWTYVIWGGLSGIFQVFGDLLAPVREKLGALVHLKAGTKLHRVLSTVMTFLFFCMSLVYFRSETAVKANMIMVKIFTAFDFKSVLTTSPFSLGLGAYHLMLLMVSMAILLAVDLYREAGHKLSELFAHKSVMRWGFYYCLVILILLSASFGAQEFIYFQF